MCNRLLLLTALLVMPLPLVAQTSADTTAMLQGRLASVERALGITDYGEPGATVGAPETPARARSQAIGRMTLLIRDEISRETATAVAERADSVLRAFGGIPDGLIQRALLVDDRLIQRALLVDDRLSSRHPLVISAAPGHEVVPLDWGRTDDTLAYGGGRITESLARYYWAQLDSVWRHWAPQTLAIRWDDDEGDAVLDHLASANVTSTGKECLAGRIQSCRLWLGIDHDSNAIFGRYTLAELVAGATNQAYGNEDIRHCRTGDHSACLRAYVQGSLYRLSRFPAPEEARASLLRALLVRHGPVALRVALADSAGAVGERLARAAGISEDSLVTEWRMWVLARGRPDRVEAGAGEFLSALFFIGILVTMAVRSGRWR